VCSSACSSTPPSAHPSLNPAPLPPMGVVGRVVSNRRYNVGYEPSLPTNQTRWPI
jgi:hypothetical protein